MFKRERVLLSGVLLSLGFVAGSAHAAEIEGYVGQDAVTVAPGVTVKLVDGNSGNVVDVDTTNFFGKYRFKKVTPGYYRLQVGEFERELMIKGDDESERIDIDLSDKSGTMDYSKAGKMTGNAAQPQKGGSQVAPQGNNATLAQQIAGVWWGYSGSTERRIGLCPDGSYQDYTESGYMGRHYDSGGYQTGAWGAASQSGGSGSWTIQGDTQRGTIYVQYNDGSSTSLNYQQIGDPGCLNINGAKLCRESANCR